MNFGITPMGENSIWRLSLIIRQSGKAPTSWFNKGCEHTISTTVNTVLIRIMFMILTLDVLFSTNIVLKRML